MIVKIDLKIFDNRDYFYILDRLTYLFERKHLWDIDNYRKIKESKWLATEQDTRLGQRAGKIIEKTVVNSGYITTSKRRDKRTIRITLTPENDNEFIPEIALRYLKSPVYVIVENFSSDKAFLQAVIGGYKEKDLKTAIDNEWIKVEGVGGIGEVPKRIDDYYKNHQGFKPRLYILVDSDRQYPGDDHNADPVVEKCKEKRIEDNLTILYKRAIENYLPLDALAEVDDELQHVYEAYNSLNNPDKWDYYNMKKGFGAKGLPEKQKKLFDGIKKGDKLFEDLKKGFEVKGFHLYSLFEKKDKITKAALKKRCKHQSIPDELEKLLKGISSLL